MDGLWFWVHLLQVLLLPRRLYDPESVVSLFSDSVYIILLLLSVLILPGLIVGLIISMFQAATQINETSLSFIPKLFVTFWF